MYEHDHFVTIHPHSCWSRSTCPALWVMHVRIAYLHVGQWRHAWLATEVVRGLSALHTTPSCAAHGPAWRAGVELDQASPDSITCRGRRTCRYFYDLDLIDHCTVRVITSFLQRERETKHGNVGMERSRSAVPECLVLGVAWARGRGGGNGDAW